MRRRSLKASMTVFLGMTMLLILSVFFSLLEVVHFTALKKEKKLLADITTESLFADYCRPMWDDYGILGIDTGYGGAKSDLSKTKDRLLSYLSDNAAPPGGALGGHHLRLAADDCEIASYGFLTDDGGAPFMNECAKAAVYSIPEGVLDTLTKQSESIGEADDSWMDSMTEAQDAYDEALEEKKAQEEEEAKEDEEVDDESALEESEEEDVWTETALTEEEALSVGNPINSVLEWKKNGILNALISEEKISKQSLSTKEPVSKRQLSKGNLKKRQSVSVSDRLLYQYYLMEHFSSFVSIKDRKGLKYELEYIIGNSGSDDENLADACEKLLICRGALNLPALLADSKKTAEAHAVAVAIAGFLGNPAVVEAVNAGIIAAWVYIESIMDVRTLLSGGKVAFAKTPADWTSQILTLGACMDVNAKAKESPSGMSYEGALCAMLSAVSGKAAGLRALDLLENELRLYPDYKSIKMDNFLYSAVIKYDFSAYPVFGSLAVIGSGPNGYEFKEEGEMSYID